MAASEAKDTIYVDVDDEITSIIDKVQQSDGKVVALVLPKRASVLQSIVNMKLLKRTAENARKHLVLITTEAGLLPLAGSVGLHVAATPTSKPAIPPAPKVPGDDDEYDDTEPVTVTAADDAADAATPAMVSAGVAQAAADLPGHGSDAVDETISMDDEPVPVAAAGGKAKKAKPNKKLRVPNFDSFRNKLLLGAGVLVLLIVGWILAFVVLPKATIIIHTDTSTITSNLNLTLDANAKSLDQESLIVPAVTQTSQKSYSQQVSATGQKNNGQPAKGSIKIVNCSASSISIDGGTAFSSNGVNLISQDKVTVPQSSYSFKPSGFVCNNDGSATVAVVAQSGGSHSFDLNGRSYQYSGQPNNVSATGQGITDGTDNIVKVVSQSDIDGAKAKITAQDTSGVKTDLQTGLQGKGYLPVTSTFVAGDPQVSTSANVGDAADTVTVTEAIAYTMLGVKQADLETLVQANVTRQLDNKDTQTILDSGVAKAAFTEQNAANSTGASVAMQAKSIVGPRIETAGLADQSAGKKSGQIKSAIGSIPGVTSVEVKYSPFWVSSAPKNSSKITVQIDKSNTGKQ